MRDETKSELIYHARVYVPYTLNPENAKDILDEIIKLNSLLAKYKKFSEDVRISNPEVWNAFRPKWTDG